MNETLASIFEKSCSSYSHKAFVYESFSERFYSYENFYQASLNFAHILNHHHPDKKIIILASKNSFLMAAAIMGTILAGKTLFLINPEGNQKNFNKLLNQLRDAYHIFGDENVELSSSSFTRLTDFSQTVLLPKTPPSPVASEDLVYVPTSATTGESKIVRQSEQAILANVNALIKHHRLDSSSSIMTPLPLFHVNALHFSFLCTLKCGGTLYLFDRFDLIKTFQTIEKYKIKILSVIPTILNNITRNFKQIEHFDISSLQYFVSAAAPLSTQTVESLLRLSNKRIIQGYGLSEAVNFSCTLPIDITLDDYRELLIQEKFPSVGVPLIENDILIRNQDGECSEGDEGEILIKSPSMMNGYLNTHSDAFFWNGYFKTGDLGYFKIKNKLRYFFISGRIKETAKINGETISMRELDEEIESIKTIPNDCISTFFPNDYRGEEVALVCSIKEGDQIPTLFDRLCHNLAQVSLDKRPRVILFTSKLPLRTPSGKAKRLFFQKFLNDFREKRFLKDIVFLDLDQLNLN